jgi:TM2 domain-containing membrane protein YozV
MSENQLMVPGGRRQADEKYCFSCGSVLHASAPNCVACGAAQPNTAAVQIAQARPMTSNAQGGLPPNYVYCRGCGTPIHFQAAACPSCGAPTAAGNNVATGGRDRDTAAILALILGGIGAHKFYLGQGVQGVFYLLLCWTFIPAVIALIEAIVYFSMTKQEFAVKYR